MKTRAPKTAVSPKTSALRTRRVAAMPRTTTKGMLSGDLKFKQILVPFDFSKPAERALGYAISFAKQFDGKLTLAYIVEPPALVGSEATMLISNNEEAVRTAREKLTALRLQRDEHGKYISDIKVVVGKPFNEITRLASALRQDVIIIATHGRTGLTHVLLGSTAEKVIRHASCPVLVIR